MSQKPYLLGLFLVEDDDDDFTMTTSSCGWGVVVVVVVVREPFLLLFLEDDEPELLLRWLGALELADIFGCCTGAAVFRTCKVDEGLTLCFLFLWDLLEDDAWEEEDALVAKTLLVGAVFFSGVTTTAGREFFWLGLKLTTR